MIRMLLLLPKLRRHDDDNNPAVSYRLFEYIDRSTVTDDGESDHGYWETSRMMLANVRKHSGNFAWKSDTANRSHHWLVSTMPYEVQPDDSLKFWIWYAIEEDWDYFYAQVSTDGGFTYTNLANDMTTNGNPNNNNLGNGITGFSGDWVEAKFSLLAYEGQQVLFRLAYYTDSYYMEEGVYIDDIANVNIFDEIVEIDPSITDTYYDFEDKVDGDYWYRLYATDNQGQDGRYSNIAHVTVQAGACCIGIRGNANADVSESINISDITYLVSYCFGGGSQPPCSEEGNANGDIEGAINISDITYLVAYCFGGGPEPPACP